MTREENGLDQVVSRTVRDSLEKIQRTSEELSQAVADLVSACASTRPMNSLPPMLRAQTSAASLAAALEVLARFVTFSLQPAAPGVAERAVEKSEEATEPVGVQMAGVPALSGVDTVENPGPSEEASAAATSDEKPLESAPEPEPVTTEAGWEQAPGAAPESSASESNIPESNTEEAAQQVSTGAREKTSENAWDESSRAALETVLSSGASEIIDKRVPDSFENASESRGESAASDVARFADYSEMPVDVPMGGQDFPSAQPGFDILSLSPEEQELHRRANRVAKVSMQDIKLLRPEDVRLGLENRDLCYRLHDDLERAYKEYERRFQTIQGHPVDYFYDWLVEILANGDPHVLGEYPYPSTVFRH